MAHNARFLVDHGIRVLIPCGNTGEFHALSLYEIEAVTEATLQAAGHDATVVVCASYDVKTAIASGKSAGRSGAKALMIHHPPLSELPEGSKKAVTAILEHWKKMA